MAVDSGVVCHLVRGNPAVRVGASDRDSSDARHRAVAEEQSQP
jgi:hypothetical protein